MSTQTNTKEILQALRQAGVELSKTQLMQTIDSLASAAVKFDGSEDGQRIKESFLEFASKLEKVDKTF